MNQIAQPSLSFISANSKNGFFSLYDSVFNIHTFDRIYLIAGGPGTGKSTFLRTVSGKAKEAGISCEEIICSSDPSSLDGVILEHEKKRIGIMDATPPHGRIIKAPAICEELIDLGAFWDAGKLSADKEKILTLMNKKAEAYRKGYALLCALGGLWESEKISLFPAFDRSKAKRQIKHKLGALKKKGEAKVRFLRAFTGMGEVILPAGKETLKNILFIGGNQSAAEIYLTYFEEIAKEMEIERTVFLSPLDGESVDGIYLPECETILIKECLKQRCDKGRRIVADRFFEFRAEESKERLHLMTAVKKMALSAFCDAKAIHSDIEEYYVAAMDFESLAEYRQRKAEEIVSTLFL